MTISKALLISTALFFSATTVFANDSMAPAASLLAKAQNAGTVKVILKLDTAFATEGALAGPAAVSRQRSQINAVQGQVLATATTGKISSVKQFETIPYIAVEVDQTALNDLLNNPQVIGVEEDGLSAPTLLQSVPFIRGDDIEVAAPLQNGSGWTVAVLDTGVRSTHIDLDDGKVVSGACFSSNFEPYTATTVCPNGATSQININAGTNCATSIDGCSHGTHVAGIAAGTYGGVAPGANIMAVQVFSKFTDPEYCGSSPSCVLSFDSDQILGLERVLAVHNASNGISIASVNMSLGGGKYGSSCDASEEDRKAVIDNLRSAGIATVIASGNDGYDGFVSTPGCISSAITVGSTLDTANSLSSFSNHGSMIDVLAPGSNIYSSIATSTTARATYNGTSMATPHVAGAFAVFKQIKPTATVSQIEVAMESSSVKITRSGVTKPRIDMFETAGLLDAQFLPADLTVPSLSVSNSTPGASTSIDINATVKNVGLGLAEPTSLRFRRSTDSKITDADPFLALVPVVALDANEESPEMLSVSTSASTGVYYYGACVDTSPNEGVTNNNCSDGAMVFVNNGPEPDAYETDNDSVSATNINDKETQFHSISPVADNDWLTFELTDSAKVVIETSSVGFAADTTLTLYDSTLSQVAIDDDGGEGSFSKLELADLPVGQYFLKVSESGNDAEIEGYFLKASIVEDDFLMLVMPAIAASAVNVSEPMSSWGVDTNLCCSIGSMTFSATIGNETRSSSLASCSSNPTFSGYTEITSGSKSIKSRFTSPNCGSASFSTIGLNFDPKFRYTVRAEFDGAPVVSVYRSSYKQATSSVNGGSGYADNPEALTLIKTIPLEQLADDSTGGQLQSANAQLRSSTTTE